MAFLMCMDTPVYSTITKDVLASHLMPCPPEHYVKWRNSRSFLRGINRMPEEDERQLGTDSITVKRRLSLSDSYWIKHNRDDVRCFSDINPYTNDFYEYGVCESDKSSPSLTLTGSVNKVWKRVNGETVLYKVMRPEWVKAEVAAVSLAEKLQIPVNKVTKISDTELFVHNFTQPGTMLMRIQPWDLNIASASKVPSDFGYTFAALDAVYKNLGVKGDFHIITALFDAVVSNYDRATNLPNWGYFKSGTDGTNTHCPLYDFNLAHPEQQNMYLHIIKPQVTQDHKTLLKQWRQAVETHGYRMWLDNIDAMLT